MSSGLARWGGSSLLSQVREASLSQQPNCPKCQSPKLRWITVRKQVPVDVLQCQNCGVTVVEEDWVAPLMPLIPGRCTNCGDRRDFDNCVNCGLNREEDAQVHDELRFMIAPSQNLLESSRIAARSGRLLMALKLATSAASVNEDDKGDVARALRVWLLSRLGENSAALEDARVWVEGQNDPPAVAWASYGQQLQTGQFPGAAADAYDKALRKDRTQHAIRARRAQLLMQLHREGQALDEACRVFEAQADDQSIEIALAVAEELCALWESQLRDDEIGRMLARAGPYVERSAKLLSHRARLAANGGDVSGAKKDLKRARRLNPELDIYERVERAMKPKSSSWWRW